MNKMTIDADLTRIEIAFRVISNLTFVTHHLGGNRWRVSNSSMVRFYEYVSETERFYSSEDWNTRFNLVPAGTVYSGYLPSGGNQ